MSGPGLDQIRQVGHIEKNAQNHWKNNVFKAL